MSGHRVSRDEILGLLQHGRALEAARLCVDAGEHAWEATAWRLAAGQCLFGPRFEACARRARDAARRAFSEAPDDPHALLEKGLARAEAGREAHGRRLLGLAIERAAAQGDEFMAGLARYERGRIGDALGWAEATGDLEHARAAFLRLDLDPEPLARYGLPVPRAARTELPTLAERLEVCVAAGQRIVGAVTVEEVHDAIDQATQTLLPPQDGDVPESVVDEERLLRLYLRELGEAALQNARVLGEIRALTDSLTGEDERLAASVAEKEATVREIQHRVKNNLQVVLSLLSLQSAHVSSEVVLGSLDAVADRLRALAMLHEHIYAREQGAEVGLDGLLRELAARTSLEPLQIELDGGPFEVPLVLAVDCGMLLHAVIAARAGARFRLGRRHARVLIDIGYDRPLPAPAAHVIEHMARRLGADLHFGEGALRVLLA